MHYINALILAQKWPLDSRINVRTNFF